MDHIQAKNVIDRLTENGISKYLFFIDREDITTGDSYVEKIGEYLNKSEIVLIIYSQNYLDSPWCKIEREIAVARSIEKKKKICVLKIENGVPVESAFLSIGLIRDLYNEDLIEVNIPLLAKELSNLLNLNIVITKFISSDKEFFDYLKYYFFNKSLSFESINESKFDLYSKFLKQICQLEGDIAQKKGNIFEDIKDHIISSKNEIPLLISGNAGSGKSTILAILFLFLWQEYLDKRFSFIPTFIDVDNFNSKVNEGDAKILFQEQINPLWDYIKRTDKKPLIILDGLDDYLKPNFDFNRDILNLISNEFQRKVIIGLSTSSGFFPSTQNIRYPAETRLILNKVSTSIDIDNFIDLFSEMYGITYFNKGNKEKIKNFVLRKVSVELDFFLMLLLCSNIGTGTKNIDSVCDLFELHILSLTDGTETSLKVCSRIAFNYYVKNDYAGRTDLIEAYDKWKIVHSNSAIRDFLIAKFIIDTLSNESELDENLEVFNHVYPSSINSYCKEIIDGSNYRLQKIIFDSIMLVYDSIDNAGQSHFCYLLGRFKNDNIKSKARTFLRGKLKIELGKYNSIPSNEVSDIKQKMLQIRTIYISLAYLNDKHSADEYVNKLIYDKSYDNINRGFHMEYYGDIPYELDDPEALTANDDLTFDINKTFNKLSSRLKNSIEIKKPHSLFSIELYTLCSLIQHRHIIGKINSSQIKQTLEISKAALTWLRVALNGDLVKYLNFFVLNVGTKNIKNRFDMIKPILKIKEIERAGWAREDKKRKVTEKIETVASHMYGCVLLAKFLLPEQLSREKAESYPSYSKDKIIQILLFHDLAEYDCGDVPSELKSHGSLKKEQNVWDYISMLTSYENIGDLHALGTDWHKLEHHENLDFMENINYYVANDIDKIENVVQLFKYNSNSKNEIPDFYDFYLSLKDNVKTEFGKDILDDVTQSYKETLSPYDDNPEV